LKQSVNCGAIQDKHAKDEAMPKEIRRDPTPAELLKQDMIKHFAVNPDIVREFQRPGVNDPQRQAVLSPRTEALQNIWAVFEHYKMWIVPLNRKEDIRLGVSSPENIVCEDAYLGAMQDVLRAMLNGADFEGLCGELPPQEDTNMAIETQEGEFVLPQMPLPYKEMMAMCSRMPPPDNGRCAEILTELATAVANLGIWDGDMESTINYLDERHDTLQAAYARLAREEAEAKAAIERLSGPKL
jgi:hypothetical protein